MISVLLTTLLGFLGLGIFMGICYGLGRLMYCFDREGALKESDPGHMAAGFALLLVLSFFSMISYGVGSIIIRAITQNGAP